MKDLYKKDGVWFVYDGECPLCSSTARALRIKKSYGALHLVDARQNADNPLVREITRRGLDLDEGMVIYARNRFHHGKYALKFMARHGEYSNVFTAFCKSLFWSDNISSLIYPWLREARNILLVHRQIGRIDNLNLKQEPIFKHIFGNAWDDLPPVMRKHYANRPYTDDLTIVEGTLNVMCKGPIKILGPVMKLLGQIPARNQSNVPVTVHFRSDANSQAFQFRRKFHFKNASPYEFRSRMVQIKANEVIEIMRFGLGWKMLYLWDGEKVILKHRGYALQLLGHFIPLPLTPLLGKTYAEETAVDDDTFDMLTHITHPRWGKIYEYKGRFKITNQAP